MTRKWTSLLLISAIALALPTLASAQYASQIPPPVEDKPFLVRLKELPGKIMNQQAGPDLVKRDAEDKQDGVWRLTDDNYHELVEGNGSSPETVWVVVIHEDQQSIMSKSFKESHANATKLYRDSLIAAPVERKVEEGEVQYKLPSDVRFARVDYITEWKLNTKWLVFKPPYLVFITEKGRDIRFLGPASPPNGEIMWDLIQSGRWQQWIPYEGLGFLQRPIDWYLVIGDLIGDRLSKIPGFVWLMISGAVGKGLMSLMHGDGETVRTTTTTVKEKIPTGAAGAKTKEEKKKKQ